jgi:hypothetical protein
MDGQEFVGLVSKLTVGTKNAAWLWVVGESLGQIKKGALQKSALFENILFTLEIRVVVFDVCFLHYGL